ncbi:MAG: hypothetical protein FJ090_13100 [Deltaproteobacteria bacterium]|nr:hypothetical protein [Deltaproteobacteria bacterium]
MSIANALGALEWNTNGGKSFDEGKGTALRNWECTGPKGLADVVIGWTLDSSVVAYDLYLGWRQFPLGRCTRTDRYFDAAYLQAMFDNQLGQAARVRLPPGALAVVDQVAANGPNDWYYAKLVGVRGDGSMVNVRGWSLGSAAYRSSGAQPGIPAASVAPVPFRRPPGHRDWKTAWEPQGTVQKPLG